MFYLLNLVIKRSMCNDHSCKFWKQEYMQCQPSCQGDGAWMNSVSSNCFKADSRKLSGVRLFLCFHRAEIMAFPVFQLLEWSCCIADTQQRQTDILPLVHNIESCLALGLTPWACLEWIPKVFLGIMGRWTLSLHRYCLKKGIFLHVWFYNLEVDLKFMI